MNPISAGASADAEKPAGHPTAAPRTDPADRPMSPVGTPQARVEGPAKVTGSVRYAADEPMENLAFGHVVTSTASRGRIAGIDVSAAEGMPGVRGVIDHRNAPRLNPEAGSFFGPDGGMHLLQNDEIPCSGRPIALVVAETIEQARAAAAALRVTYEEAPHDTGFSSTTRPAGRRCRSSARTRPSATSTRNWPRARWSSTSATTRPSSTAPPWNRTPRPPGGRTDVCRSWTPPRGPS